MIVLLLIVFSLGLQPAQNPATIVRGYLEALKALDAAKMHLYLANDFTIVSSGGQEALYNRARSFQICEWERGMNTRWSYQIIGVNGNDVSVILTERNDYWTFLGTGPRTEVEVFVVEAEKIKREIVKHSVVERGTQEEALQRFKDWLRQQLAAPEPDLLTPEGRLILSGKSAPRMRYWLQKWHKSQKRGGR